MYRIVVADSQSPRDGKFIEIVGQYAPRTGEQALNLKTRSRELLARHRRAADGHGSLAAPQGRRAQGAPRGAPRDASCNAAAVPVAESSEDATA